MRGKGVKLFSSRVASEWAKGLLCDLGTALRAPLRLVVLNLMDCCVCFLQEHTAAWVEAWSRQKAAFSHE